MVFVPNGSSRSKEGGVCGQAVQKRPPMTLPAGPRVGKPAHSEALGGRGSWCTLCRCLAVACGVVGGKMLQGWKPPVIATEWGP